MLYVCDELVGTKVVVTGTNNISPTNGTEVMTRGSTVLVSVDGKASIVDDTGLT